MKTSLRNMKEYEARCNEDPLNDIENIKSDILAIGDRMIIPHNDLIALAILVISSDGYIRDSISIRIDGGRVVFDAYYYECEKTRRILSRLYKFTEIEEPGIPNARMINASFCCADIVIHILDFGGKKL